MQSWVTVITGSGLNLLNEYQQDRKKGTRIIGFLSLRWDRSKGQVNNKEANKSMMMLQFKSTF